MADDVSLESLLGFSQEQFDQGIEIDPLGLGGEDEEKASQRGRKRGRRAGTEGEGGEGEKEEPSPFYQIAQPGPNPFDEPAPQAFVPPEGFLPHDSQDQYIPKNSFIGDFIYRLKGYESPVLFNIWGAIYALSVMSGRQTWYKFGAEKLFPNMYILWIAKPGVCKKSTALGLATALIQKLPDQFPDDPYMREATNIDYITSKAPSDAIALSLKPKVRTFILPDGGIHQVSFGSRTYVTASELATFLNTKKFNTGMVDTLTDLYDCREKDRELTRGRGMEGYENYFFCLGGACTPMHMETSFPPEAKGGGFMSRCILVHQEFPAVWHDEPEEYAGFPQTTDLQARMRWLAYNTRGEYYLTPEAKAHYKEWYMSWRNSLFQRGVQDDALAETRQDVLTLKVATLLRMAEYRQGHDITLQNWKDAHRLLTYTLSHSAHVTSGLGAKEKKQSFLRVRALLQKKGTLTRRQLLQHTSPKGIYVSEIQPILAQLVQEDFLTIKLDGFSKITPGIEGREVYVWTGPTAEGERVKEEAHISGEGAADGDNA